MIRRLALLLLLFVMGTPSLLAQLGEPKSFNNGLVVSATEQASQIGVDIMQKGGNAVDAAVAVNFALAVTYPQAGNIGGGGFMVISLANGTVTTLDFRETAPQQASQDMYLNQNDAYQEQKSRVGALASGIPGTVDGMIRAVRRYGNLPLEIVLQPAIRLAREGFPLTYDLANILNDHAEEFKQYEATADYFLPEDDSSWDEGDLLVQKDLANTLDRISRFGREGFYSGITADHIIETMNRHGGIIGYRDLNQYSSKWREPISAEFNDYTLHMMPPPSSGGVAIKQMLYYLQDFRLDTLGFNSANYIHLLTESMRRSFADRAKFLGDPDHSNIPIDYLTSSFYNDDRFESFNWDSASSSQKISHGKLPAIQESYETTHFSIVDPQGNAVSVTTTLNGWFGSKVSVAGSGFLLNNEMDDFTAKPGEPNQFGLIQGKANAIAPGKRMLSSMTPAIVTKNGAVHMVLGAAGGPRIINTVLQNFLDMSVFDMNAQQAVSAPRIHHQWMPDQLFFEKYTISPDTRIVLKQKGHQLKAINSVGRAHIIRVDSVGNRNSGVDPRGTGHALGF